MQNMLQPCNPASCRASLYALGTSENSWCGPWPVIVTAGCRTAEAGASSVVSVAHVSATETPGLPLLGCCRGVKPGHEPHLCHGLLWCKFNCNQICWWHPNQSGSKQRRQTQTANDPERSEQWEHYRQEEKFISGKRWALPRERKCSSRHFLTRERKCSGHHFWLSTALQRARL